MENNLNESPIRMLILDDDKQRADFIRELFPQANVVWVDNVNDCLLNLQESWDVIRLDHDLGGEVFVDSSRPDCGMEVVRHLTTIDHKHLEETLFICHSRFERAGEEMAMALSLAGYDAMYRAFSFNE